MLIKRIFKKTSLGANILQSGAEIQEYSAKMAAVRMIDKLKKQMLDAKLKIPPGIEYPIDFDLNDMPVINRIEVGRLSEKQNIGQKTIDRLMETGSVIVGDGQIMIKSEPPVNYHIDSVPGHYCCHDGKKLSDEKSAREYVKANFDGVESPDKANPSGYRKDNFYSCTLIGVE